MLPAVLALFATGSTPVAGQTSGATFTRDVAPILFDKCVGCHHTGGIAPFPLTTYAAVRPRAAAIADAVARRNMPPWRAEGPEFVGQKRLTSGEIALLRDWAAAGAPEGDARPLPSVPETRSPWQHGTPDLVLTPRSPANVPATGGDFFHTFVLRVPGTSTHYVRGVEFLPGNAHVVHHATILIDRTAQSRELLQEGQADPQGLIPRSAEFPSGQILGWTPGQVDVLLPSDIAWPLEPGTDLIVQLHLMPMNHTAQVTPSIGLYFTPEKPKRSPTLLRLGSESIDIAAGDPRYTFTDSLVLPADAQILALKPHAHFRAREIDAWAVAADGTRTQLLRISDWDFKWQHVYRYEAPVMLAKGTTIAARFVYDNSAESPRNPQLPPQRVRWGPRSSDEMGDLWIQLLPRRDEDLPVLSQAFRRHSVEQDIDGYRRLLEKEPDNRVVRQDLALLYIELGRPLEAVPHYEAALRVNPGSSTMRLALGTALMLAGQPARAIGELERAIGLEPNVAAAHANLGNALRMVGQHDRALGEYREALRLQPASASAHNNIGLLLMERGRWDEAATFFETSLRLDERLVDAHFNLALALRQRRADAEAVSHLRRALQLAPDWPKGLSALAWILATGSDAVRRPSEALPLAERAVSLTNRRDTTALESLAAASAGVGAFDAAMSAIDEVLALHPEDPDGVRARRKLYQQRQVYREP